MSGIFKSFKTDSAKEEEGVKIELFEAENEDKTIPAFYVARAGKGNKAYAKALETATRPYKRQIQLGTFDSKKQEAIYLDVFCSTVLKSWENIYGEDGKLIPFSKANAVSLFGQLPELFDRVFEESTILENFKIGEREEDAKN